MLRLIEDDENDRDFLKEYEARFFAFYGEIHAEINELIEGFTTCLRILNLILNLLEKPAEERIKIGRGYLKSFIKDFLYGLNRINNGLKMAFDPEFVGKTKITTGQLASFILDRKIGLGTKFAFNSGGKDSFCKKLPHLNRQEIIAVERLLLKPELTRHENGWADLGKSREPVRILCHNGRVYFLFRLNEHSVYETYLDRVNPEKVQFRAAA